MQLLLGKPAPAFDLPSSEGGTIGLRHLRGKNVVLYFYPKDDTPGCTLEAQGFTQARAAFAAQDTVVLGVSKDTVAAHCKFRDKYGLAIPLLSDPDGKVIEAYGAWGEKNMYGKITHGIIRSTFLIDASGVVAKEWRKVKVPGHVQEVLDAANQLSRHASAPTRNNVMNTQMNDDMNNTVSADMAAAVAKLKKAPAKAKKVAKTTAKKAKQTVAKAAKAVKATAKKPAKKAVAKKAVAKKPAKKAVKAVKAAAASVKKTAKKVVAKARKTVAKARRR